MKSYWKRYLRHYLNARPSINRRVVTLRHSYDEVYKMVQKLGASPKKKS